MGFDAAPMQANQSLNQREPHSEAPLTAIDLAVHLRKQLEDSVDILGKNTDPGITHAQHGFAATPRELQRNAATGLGVLRRVVQQIRQDLSETGEVPLYPEALAGQIHRQLMP